MCNRAVGGSLLLIVGAALIVASIGAPYLVRKLLRKQLVYANGTTLYASWIKPATQDFDIYMMNITNLDAVLNGSKPEIDEIGPYIYDDYTGPVPETVRFSDGGNVVHYQTGTHYVFNADKTRAANGGSDLDPANDVFVLPNILLHSVLSLCKNPASILAPVCPLFEIGVLSDLNVTAFDVTTLDEFIWGRQTPFSVFLNGISQGLVPTKFGVLKNNTVDVESSIKTGKDDENTVGQFVTWLGHQSLSAWGSRFANMINGTGGTVFRPYLDRDNVKQLYVFVDQVNRSFNLHYGHDIDVQGITCRRYSLPKSEMSNASLDPTHAEFFAFGPSGLMNMSAIQGGFPIFMSKPHFLHGDPQLLENVTIHNSSSPSSSLLDTTLDVEPITGITLSARKTLQTNLYISPYTGVLAEEFGIERIRNTYLPTFWIQAHAEIEKPDAQKLQKSVILPYNIVNSKYMYIAVAGGGVLVMISCMLVLSYIRRYCRRGNAESQALVNFSDEDEDEAQSYGTSGARM